MKPYYNIDLATKAIILKLCAIPDLGNVSFQHYPTAELNDTITFSMDQQISGWGLVVYSDSFRATDIYKVLNGQIIHDYSKRDKGGI